MIVLTEVENLVLPMKMVRILAGIDAIASRRRISHHQTIPAAHNGTYAFWGDRRRFWVAAGPGDQDGETIHEMGSLTPQYR
ncbi:hypothetical protein MNBD_ACTINO01-2202 [hydrothermal vent metagenome]|uniref:Uncharacterized protein n=1 Tax=hydrothermal vent metagenome TaxID=652676 RepID=A0A3B0S3W0_9ZZZZ